MNSTRLVLVTLITLTGLAFTPSASAQGPLDVLNPDGDCTNYGVMTIVGNFECADCTNHGVVVWVGNTCWGTGPAGACVDSVCADSSKVGSVSTHKSSCCPIPPGIVSGTPGEGCGMVDDPACWSLRLACYYVGPPIQREFPHFHCTTQPDADDGDLDLEDLY